MNKKGFTLIELLIVISLIGILAGVVISVVDPQRQRSIAEDSVTQSTMNKLAEGLEAYYSVNGSYPVDISESNPSFIYVDNIPDTLVYSVDNGSGVFNLCHVTSKSADIYFVYSSSTGNITECDRTKENCGSYGCY